MPDTYPLSLLSKATGISRGRPAWKEAVSGALEAGIDSVLGAVGLSTGSKAAQVGELLSAAVPILGAPKALKALTVGKLAAQGKKAQQAAAVVPKPGIKAYHGSPHDFEKFSLSKIGTGEGAQVYGHGLYFAENPKVAQGYRETLSQGQAMAADAWGTVPQALTSKGRTLTGDSTLWEAARWLEVRGGDVAQTVADIQASSISKSAKRGLVKKLQEYPDLTTTKAEPGRTYEVNINADPNDFFDWDVPLSQQPQRAKILEAMKQRGLPLDESGVPLWAQRDPNGEAIHAALNPADGSAKAANATATGHLQQAGIPGIKYLDGLSRGKGKGSRNYVVFDEALIDILKKYGLAGLTTAALPLSRLARPQSEPVQPPVAKY